MKIKIDKETDALYFRLDDSEIVESEEVENGVILDFNKDGKVVGVEILNISQKINPEQLKIYNLKLYKRQSSIKYIIFHLQY